MTDRIWRGGASARAQQTNATPLNVEVGNTYALQINGRVIEVESTLGTVGEVVNAFVTAIGNFTSSIPEWAEVGASVGTDGSGQVTHLVMTGLAEGKPFIVTGGAGTSEILITRSVAGEAGDNQQQMVSIEGATAGTFTLTVAGLGTTNAIAYNATAGAVDLELFNTLLLQTTVTGNAGGPWLIEMTDDEAQTDLALFTGDGSSLTKAGGYAVTIETLTNGSSQTNAIQAITLIGTPTSGTFSLRYAGYGTAGLAYNITAAALETALEAVTSIGAGNVSVTEPTDNTYYVEFIGDLAGQAVEPLEVSGESIIVSTLDGIAAVYREQAASSGTNAVYTVTPGTAPVSLTVTTDDGINVTTSSIPAGATAVEVQQRLFVQAELDRGCYVSNSGGQNRDTYQGGPWLITFISSLGARVVTMTSSSATVAATTAGSASAVPEIQTIVFQQPGTYAPRGANSFRHLWRFGFAALPNSTTAYSMKMASGGAAPIITSSAVFIEFLTRHLGLVASAVTLTETAEDLRIQITYDTDTHNENVPLIQIDLPVAVDTVYYEDTVIAAGVLDNDPATAPVIYSGVVSETVQEYSPSTNEVQRVTLSGSGGGTFQLTHKTIGASTTTAAIAYNATAAAVEAALELLASIDAVDVTGNVGGPYLVEWPNGINSLQFVGVESLSGGAVDVAIVQSSSDQVDEIQRIELTDSPTGTFTLTFGGQTTSSIVPEASAQSVRSALETLSSITVGQVLVAKTQDFRWDVKFVGTLGGAGKDLITATSTLTSGGADSYDLDEAISATGPNHWTDRGNWSGSTVPVGADSVYFEASDIDCLYGLAQSAITLTSLNVASSYSGNIGLQNYNGDYYEYRDKYLQIGATTLSIGDGDGSGSSRIKINVGTIQTTAAVTQTAAPEDDAVGAFVIVGTHVSNTLNVQRGDVGVATEEPGQDSKFASIQQGYIDTEDTDSNVRIGSGVTQLTLVEQTGGTFLSKAAVTTLTNRGGQATISGSATVGTLDVSGTVFYSTSGTMTQGYVRSGGVLGFDRSMAARTVTNLSMFAGSGISDRNRTVTWTNPIVLSGCSIADCELELGTNITIDIATA